MVYKVLFTYTGLCIKFSENLQIVKRKMSHNLDVYFDVALDLTKKAGQVSLLYPLGNIKTEHVSRQKYIYIFLILANTRKDFPI